MKPLKSSRVYILSFHKYLNKKMSSLPCSREHQIHLIPGAVPDLFAQVTSSNKITLADRYGLLAALLQDSLTSEERASIDRILYALHRGRLKVVDDISAT